MLSKVVYKWWQCMDKALS